MEKKKKKKKEGNKKKKKFKKKKKKKKKKKTYNKNLIKLKKIILLFLKILFLSSKVYSDKSINL